MLDLPGASVQAVEFTNDGILVNVRLRKKRAVFAWALVACDL